MALRKDEIHFPAADGVHQIYGEMHMPQGEMRGIFQMAHGMCDYVSRYRELLEALAQAGYVACGADHLGHGNSIAGSDVYGFMGEKNGYDMITRDFARFYQLLSERFPQLPHFVMGHSMGSFVVRYFLSFPEARPAGAILMGTAPANPMAASGIALIKFMRLVKGSRYRSKTIEKMAFSGYNQRVENPAHDWAWLTRDIDASASFLEDEKRKETFTLAGFEDLFRLLRLANQNEILRATPDIPLLFLSGDHDPLGRYGKGIAAVSQRYRETGHSQVEMELFPGARHELSHETNKAEVYESILHWLERQNKKGANLV